MSLKPYDPNTEEPLPPVDKRVFPCGCVERIGSIIKKEQNSYIKTCMLVSFDKDGLTKQSAGIEIQTGRYDSKKKGRLARLWCKYCPFCGSPA